MLNIRKSGERGHYDHGWLDTRHTFSFGQFYDPKHLGFRSMRVLNDDIVQPHTGFGEHEHRNMEIISYPVHGRFAHRDSTGHESSIGPGQVQVMTAGSGIKHSEFNHSDQPVRFLQIWIQPSQDNLEPTYTERDFSPTSSNEGLRLLVSPDGRDESLTIHQDALISRLLITQGEQLDIPLDKDRVAWLQVIEGDLSLDGVRLESGDGVAIEQRSCLRILAKSDLQALLFTLPA
ncbi:MAG: pirin family protein [Planctomycetota bacterium]|nr:pirin family protein [Planctomycetota bacterium]